MAKDEESLISKINKLMALAMDERAPEGERATAGRMADKLILQNQIDRVKLGKKQETGGERIVVEDFDTHFPVEFMEQAYHLFYWIMEHGNVRLKMRGYMHCKMVGYESDVEYSKQLWVHVYREFAGNLFPKWSADATFDSNVYAHVKGGYKWAAIANVANKHGVEVPWPDGGRLKRAYHRECKARGEEPTAHTQRHEAFRASYAQSFQAVISQRLREMRARTEGEIVDDRDRYALVVKTNKEKVDAEFYKLYPEYDPAVQARRFAEEQAAEEARRAAMTQAERDAEDAREAKLYAQRRKAYDRVRDNSYDPNGWAQGTRVAKNVDLTLGKNAVAPNRRAVEG